MSFESVQALSDAMKKVKEETRRAMEPQIQQLKRNHENALNQLQMKLCLFISVVV